MSLKIVNPSRLISEENKSIYIIKDLLKKFLKIQRCIHQDKSVKSINLDCSFSKN